MELIIMLFVSIPPFYLSSSKHFTKSLNHGFYGGKWPKRWSSPNTSKASVSSTSSYHTQLTSKPSRNLLSVPFQIHLEELRIVTLGFSFALKHRAKFVIRRSSNLVGQEDRRAREDKNLLGKRQVSDKDCEDIRKFQVSLLGIRGSRAKKKENYSPRLRKYNTSIVGYRLRL